MSKVKVSIEGHYEVQEMSNGKDYVWQPSHSIIACDCGQVMDADEHHTTCPNCGAEHSDLMQQVVGRQLSDDVLHPFEATRSGRGSRRDGRVSGMVRTEGSRPGVIRRGTASPAASIGKDQPPR
jgi:hypothetical protein